MYNRNEKKMLYLSILDINNSLKFCLESLIPRVSLYFRIRKSIFLWHRPREVSQSQL